MVLTKTLNRSAANRRDVVEWLLSSGHEEGEISRVRCFQLGVVDRNKLLKYCQDGRTRWARLVSISPLQADMQIFSHCTFRSMRTLVSSTSSTSLRLTVRPSGLCLTG